MAVKERISRSRLPRCASSLSPLVVSAAVVAPLCLPTCSARGEFYKLSQAGDEQCVCCVPLLAPLQRRGSIEQGLWVIRPPTWKYGWAGMVCPMTQVMTQVRCRRTARRDCREEEMAKKSAYVCDMWDMHVRRSRCARSSERNERSGKKSGQRSGARNHPRHRLA